MSAKLALAMLDRGWDVTTISARDEGFSYGTQWSEPWLALEEHTHRITYGAGHASGGDLLSASARAYRCDTRLPKCGGRTGRANMQWELHRQAPFDACAHAIDFRGGPFAGNPLREGDRRALAGQLERPAGILVPPSLRIPNGSRGAFPCGGRYYRGSGIAGVVQYVSLHAIGSAHAAAPASVR